MDGIHIGVIPLKVTPDNIRVFRLALLSDCYNSCTVWLTALTACNKGRSELADGHGELVGGKVSNRAVGSESSNGR
jgi:hypothetical protein